MKLSICVPVFENAGLLRDCIARFIAQKEVFQGEAEIVVFDGSKGADARETAGEAAIGQSDVYYLHEPDVPVSRLMRRCAEVSRGEFVWVVSGLELVTPGTLVYVRAIFLNKGLSRALQILVLNHSSMASGLESSLGSHDTMMDDVSVADVQHFEPGLGLLNYFKLTEFRYPACLVLNRASFLSTPEQTQDHQFAHLGTVIRMCSAGGAAFAPRLSMISRREAAKDDYDEISLETVPKLYEEAVELGYRKSHSKRAVRQLAPSIVREFMKRLRAGDFESTSPSRMGKLHGGHRYYWTTMLPAWLWFRLTSRKKSGSS